MATRKVAVRKKPRPKRRRPPAEQEEVLEEKAEPVAPKPARRRKAKPVAKPAPKPEPVVEEGSDYDEWELRELRDELKERELATRGNKAKLIMRLLADDKGEEDAEPEPAKPVAKPARRGRRKAEAVPESEEEVEDGPGLSMEGSMAEFLESVGTGQSIAATRIDEDTWQFAIGAGVASVAQPVGMGLKGKAYWQEVASQEYWDFDNVDAGDGKSWHDMTVEEREEMAAEYGITIDEDLNPKVRAMRLKPALLKELGIYKYKEEYRTRSARNAVR